MFIGPALVLHLDLPVENGPFLELSAFEEDEQDLLGTLKLILESHIELRITPHFYDKRVIVCFKDDRGGLLRKLQFTSLCWRLKGKKVIQRYDPLSR